MKKQNLGGITLNGTNCWFVLKIIGVFVLMSLLFEFYFKDTLIKFENLLYPDIYNLVLDPFLLVLFFLILSPETKKHINIMFKESISKDISYWGICLIIIFCSTFLNPMILSVFNLKTLHDPIPSIPFDLGLFAVVIYVFSKIIEIIFRVFFFWMFLLSGFSNSFGRFFGAVLTGLIFVFIYGTRKNGPEIGNMLDVGLFFIFFYFCRFFSKTFFDFFIFNMAYWFFQEVVFFIHKPFG